MNNIEELNAELNQVKKLTKSLEDKIKLLEKEDEGKKQEEVITYAIGDIVTDKYNNTCMLVQPQDSTVVLINLVNGNRYYDSFYKVNVNNVNKISKKEFIAICNNEENRWSKVEFRFNWE